MATARAAELVPRWGRDKCGRIFGNPKTLCEASPRILSRMGAALVSWGEEPAWSRVCWQAPGSA